jgi:hypothetical protein
MRYLNKIKMCYALKEAFNKEKEMSLVSIWNLKLAYQRGVSIKHIADNG